MPYCNLLDTHICVVLPGLYKPCCQYTVYNELYQDIKVHEMTHTEYVNTTQYQKIKNDMKTGWHKGCEKCKLDEEIYGIESYRQYSNRFFKKNKNIQYVEISLSNNCNLSCKMCNPNSSSKWSNMLDNNEDLKFFLKSYNFSNIDCKLFFKDVNLKNLRKIKYLGGEPFITPETKELFDFFQEKNIINNVELLTNTNCTFFPKKWIDQLLNFKYVHVGLSIDGFDKSCEYSRTGSNWEIILENIQKWKNLCDKNKNISVYFSSTINCFTVHDYQKLKKLANELRIKIDPYVIHQPSYLRLEALPAEYLQSIRNDDNAQFIDCVKFDSELFKKLKNFVKVTDKAQNINIADYIPKLAKYIDNN